MNENGVMLESMPNMDEGSHIKERLKNTSAKFNELLNKPNDSKNLFDIALDYIQQLENERDEALKLAAPVKYGLVRTEAKIAIPAVITNPYYCHRCGMQFAVLNDKPEAVMHCPFCGARRGEPPKTEL